MSNIQVLSFFLLFLLKNAAMKNKQSKYIQLPVCCAQHTRLIKELLKSK